MDNQTRTEIEAAAFRSLIGHLQKRTDVQNIDLMILAGFCRNCLAKWYKKAAVEHDIDMDYKTALKAIYNMPYANWKEQHQTVVTPHKLAAYEIADKAEI